MILKAVRTDKLQMETVREQFWRQSETLSHNTVIKEPHELTIRDLDTDSEVFCHELIFRSVPWRNKEQNAWRAK